MKRTLVLLAAASTALIACGDDDDDDTAGGATTVAGEATTADGGTAGGDNAEYCAALAEFLAGRQEFLSMLEGGTATPEELETELTELGVQLEAVIDTAPAEIQGDINAIAGPTFAMITALQEVDYDLAALEGNAAASEALNQLQSPNYTEAAESLEVYGAENCGITID